MKLAESLVAEPPPLHFDADGVARVGGTRVTLDTVVGAWKDGATAEEIVEQYDSLRLADVHAVISYFLRHEPEVESYLARRKTEAESIRKENEKRFPHKIMRERLLTRHRGRART